jgi:ABC-type phosphate transport system substrate-binding protein
MKYTKIAVACGLALAAMSAQAAGPTIPVGTKVVFLSGATAPDNFLADIANSMMTSVTAIRSNDAGILHRAYLGKAAAGIPGVAVGSDILFIKRSKGGSVWGVDPVARAQRVETLDLNNCVVGTAPFAWSCGTKGIDPGIAGHETAANTGLVPDFGVSDVEPRLFQEPFNTENGQPQLAPSELGVLGNKPLNQIMMGIVATNAVSATTHLSRAQYGAMLAGKIDTWEQVDGSTDPVVVCRRVNGSGTQTSYNWFFSGFPCNTASLGYLDTPPAEAAQSFGFDGSTAGTAADPFIIDPTAGLTIVENSGSGDVRNCLKAAQDGTDFTVKGSNNQYYKVLFSNVGGPSKAIGVLSLDSYNNANAANSGWSFRHLDGAGTFNGATQTSSAGATGIAPSKANLLNGKYDFVVELSMQARTATVTNPNGDVVAPITADSVKNAFYNEFVKRAGSTKYTGNDGGTFTSVPNAFASLPQFTSYATKPAFVSKYSRNGNTCAPLVSFPAL